MTTEAVFNKLNVKATLKLNYFTDNRIKYLDTEDIPDEVKFTLAEFVDIINTVNEQIEETGSINLASYSNGIESFSFNGDSSNPEKTLNSLLWSKVSENLSNYPELIYRGVR